MTRSSGIRNEELPAAFDAAVGDRLLLWLTERYNRGINSTAGWSAAAPGNGGIGTLEFVERPSVEAAKRGLEQILAWFQINSYMRSFEVTMRKAGGSSGCEFVLKLVAPATRWSQEVLAQRRSLIGNAYEVRIAQPYSGLYKFVTAAPCVLQVKVCLAYLRACGIEATANPPRFDKLKGTEVYHTLVVKRGLEMEA